MAHPFFVKQYRQKARYHLQIEIIHEGRAQDADYGGRCEASFTAKGTIRRIFLGDSAISLEDNIIFTMIIHDHKKGLLFGPAAVKDRCYDAAKYMEVFLVGESPKYTSIVSSYCVIEKLTSEPTMSC